MVGDRCCLDADSNGVCDVDETHVTPVLTQNETDDSEEIETKSKVMTKAGAEDVAQLFAEKWKLKQFNLMYSMLSPELKAKKTVAEFTAIMQLESLYKKVNDVQFKGVQIADGDSEGAISLQISTNLQEDIKIPELSMVYTDDGWKVFGFADVFDMPAFDAACSSYRDNPKYQITECAKDFSIKVKDVSFCDQAGCYYTACLRGNGEEVGIKEEAEQCNLCPPLHSSATECILDLALVKDKIAICDYIDDKKFSDKYCTCYGGYALAKKSDGYCNLISDPDYKDLCEKKYDGEYC
jgi:hypothetical protein